MVVVITFTAKRGVVQLDEHKLRRAAFACAAGIFLGVLFLTFEVMTHFAVTRLAMNSNPSSTGGRRFIFQSRLTTSKPPWKEAPPEAGMPRS